MRKFVVPEFIFGDGAVDHTANFVNNFSGENVLLVTDNGLINAGWAGQVEDILKDAGIHYHIFKDITPNPKDYEVMEGTRICIEQKCDIIVAIGGGSVMDCAKGIGIASCNQKHVLEFEGVDEVPKPGPPLICIPTTAGTAADISQFAIINNTTDKVKIAIISKTVVPDVALIDPLLTSTMDPELTAETGMDALVHAFEAFVSTGSSPITDLHALHAIKLIWEYLPVAYNESDNIHAREMMMLGSHYAGMAFSNASLGLVHSMAHSMGGLLDFAHGLCNALLLEVVVDFNYKSSIDKYNKISKTLGLKISGKTAEHQKDQLVKAIQSLRHSLDITSDNLNSSVTPDQILQMSKNACNDPCSVTNPYSPTVDLVRSLYEKIFTP